jgi:hypothetical protein
MLQGAYRSFGGERSVCVGVQVLVAVRYCCKRSTSRCYQSQFNNSNHHEMLAAQYRLQSRPREAVCTVQSPNSP